MWPIRCAKQFQLTWNSCANAVLARAARAAWWPGNSPTGPLVSAVASGFALNWQHTVLRLTGSLDSTRSALFGFHGVATGLGVDDAIWSSAEDIGRRLEPRSPDAGRPPMPCRNWGVPVIATSWCWWSVLPPVLAIFPAVWPALPTDRDPIGRQRFLFSTLIALLHSPWLPALAARTMGWKEPDWLAGCCSRPQRGWTACATGTARPWNAAFRRPPPGACSDYSAGWC